MEIIDLLDRGCSISPHKTCVADSEDCLTYLEVHDLCGRLANQITQSGVEVGAHAAILGRNSVGTLVSLLGILRAGLVWLPVNPAYASENISHLLQSFDCQVILFDEEFRQLAEHIKCVAIPDVTLIPFGRSSRHLAKSLNHLSPSYSRRPKHIADVAAIMSTGGTTGLPKGVLQSNQGFLTFIANQHIHMQLDSDSRYLVVAPMTHAAGFLCFSFLGVGAEIWIGNGAKPSDVAHQLSTDQITDVFLPPTIIYGMLADPDIISMKFPKLRHLLYGSAPMAPAKLQAALRWLGPVMVQGYGQVEALMFCTIFLPEDHFDGPGPASLQRLSSCGRPALMGRVGIMDDAGVLLGPGQVGEIVVRGGHVMLGYYKDPEATEEVSKFGWHHSGDLGYQDEEGFIYLVDRKRDLVVSGGLNVFPSEVEAAILSLDAVVECVVTSSPDEKWGEAVTAVVVLMPGSDATEEDIIAVCKSKLGSIKSPKIVQFWDEIPKTPVGKAHRREVRNHFWREHDRGI